MNGFFGIHIGNTNAYIGFCKENGYTEVIANEVGERATPSIVLFTDEEEIVGGVAKSVVTSKWMTTIHENKSIMHMEKNELENNVSCNKVQTVVINEEINYCIPLSEKTIYVKPQNIAKCIFKKLHMIARSALAINDKNMSCVLLVPHHFSDNFCKIYRNAAENAGWIVMQIINETAAGILAYSLLDCQDESQNVLVYRLGGTTCEVAVYEISKGMLFLMGSEFRKETGGNLIINSLTEFLANEFFKKYKLDVMENRRSIDKLKIAAEKSFHALSKTPATNCFIESLFEGIDFSCYISRARLELLFQPYLDKYTEPIKSLINIFNLKETLDKVILCGGATSVPKIQSEISNLFDINVTQILTCHNQDEVLAIGAAKQAYYLFQNEVTEFLPKSMEIPVEMGTYLDY